MSSHKNARTTFEGRKLLIERIGAMGLKPAAQAAGISERTARKWLKRFEEHGVQGLLDRSSRPARARTSMNAHLAERIERLRRARMPMRHIAQVVGRSVATVSRLLACLGLSSLRALEPVQAVLRYEWPAPGELLDMDTKKLGRIERVGHRITGNQAGRCRGAGVPAGSLHMSPLTITHAQASCRCTAMSARIRSWPSCRLRWRTTRLWG